MTERQKWLVRVEERQACYAAVRELFDRALGDRQHPEAFAAGQRDGLASAMEVITARNYLDGGAGGLV